MEKLVLIEDINPDDLVRYYFPMVDDEDVDWILWNVTCFPYGPIGRINDMIYEWYLKSRV